MTLTSWLKAADNTELSDILDSRSGCLQQL